MGPGSFRARATAGRGGRLLASSTVVERIWTERLSPVLTKREGFVPNNEVLPLPLRRGHLLLSGKMARPEPERSGLEDPDQYIRDQMPPWARWEENIIEEDGKKHWECVEYLLE